MKLVFLGPPGAGKGTQAARVAQTLAIPHISTGEMFRKAIREGTPLGNQAKLFIDAGNLVPDALVLEMVGERVKQPDCGSGFLLDGFPRTLEQAERLSGIAPIDVVIDIAVNDDKLVDRLSGRRVCPSCGGTYHNAALENPDACPNCGSALVQRVDDNEVSVLNRLQVYHELTGPLTDYYTKRGKLRAVDGDRPVEQITEEILRVVTENS